MDYVLDYIQSSELLHFQQTQYFEELDSTFATLEHVLNLVQQQLEAWDIGFSALATGHLSLQIVPPTSLQQAIKEINTHLPLGWAIPSEELWVIYREARVTAALINDKLRLFIDIPIFDHAQDFKLFQIISLPKSTANGTHGVRFTNLPHYLAVSPDLDTFVEFSEMDMLKCRQFDKHLCTFHRGFSKRGPRTSCAVALFTNDTLHIQEYCQTQFVQGNVPEVAYLGLNRWAFSATEPHTVVFSCPTDSKHLPPQRRQLPPIGYFEVPSGCTARTDHWIFPASLKGSSMLAAIPSQTFNFEGMRPNITLEKTVTVIHFLSLNLTHLNHVSNILVQQSTLEAQASMTNNQIATLLAAQKSLPHQSPYPYEWVAAFCFLSFCLARCPTKHRFLRDDQPGSTTSAT